MILLVTPSTAVQSRFTDYLQPYDLVMTLSSYQLLLRTLEKLAPEMLYLDFSLPGLLGVDSIVDIRERFPLTKVVVIGHRLSEDTKIDLFLAGVAGYCNSTSEKPQVENIVLSIKRGELCIPRALGAALLTRLKQVTAWHAPEVGSAQISLLCLTKREKEISALIGLGHNNKEIARKLGIAERTVKAHLTEIFRKLGVTDRLALALIVTASQTTVRTDRLKLVGA